MMKLYLTFFCVILTLIAGSSALPATNELANSLFKRTQCKCGVFLADFGGSSGSKRSEGAVGMMTFSQDENGYTTVTGIFKSGFKDVKDPKFALNDHCGNKLFDLSGLNVQPTEDGGTKSFRKVFKDLSMDCGPESIFTRNAKITSCGGSDHHKRQAGPPEASAVPPGTSSDVMKYTG
jgi:hypothetical protein